MERSHWSETRNAQRTHLVLILVRAAFAFAHAQAMRAKQQRAYDKAGGGAAAKKARDPNAPKRPLAAYMHFSQATRPRVLEENPGIAFGQVGVQLGAMWKELSAKKRAPFEASLQPFASARKTL